MQVSSVWPTLACQRFTTMVKMCFLHLAEHTAHRIKLGRERERESGRVSFLQRGPGGVGAHCARRFSGGAPRDCSGPGPPATSSGSGTQEKSSGSSPTARRPGAAQEAAAIAAAAAESDQGLKGQWQTDCSTPTAGTLLFCCVLRCPCQHPGAPRVLARPSPEDFPPLFWSLSLVVLCPTCLRIQD